jgi:hypothetical protein
VPTRSVQPAFSRAGRGPPRRRRSHDHRHGAQDRAAGRGLRPEAVHRGEREGVDAVVERPAPGARMLSTMDAPVAVSGSAGRPSTGGSHPAYGS